MQYVPLFLYLLLFSLSKEETILELGYNWNVDGYNTMVLMGSPKIPKVFVISFDFDFTFSSTYLEHSRFNISTSLEISYLNESISLQENNNQNVTATVLTDVLHFESKSDYDATLNKFSFYYVYPNQTIINDAMGFAFSIKNKNKNAMYMLKKNNLIEHMEFAFVPPSNFKGDFFIGGLPLRIKKNYPFYVNCEVKDNWGCHISYIEFNKKKIPINKYSKFLSNIFYNIAPTNFLDYIINNYLKDKIEKKDCRAEWYSTKKKIFCICASINDFPDMIIAISGKKLVYRANELFTSFIDECEFVFHGTTEDNDELILSTGFLSNFVSEFDYDNKQVRLRSKTQFEDAEFYGDVKIVKIFYIITIIVIFIWMIVISSNKFFGYFYH